MSQKNVAVAAVLLAVATTAQAADRIVQMQAQPAVRKGIQAMPQIARPQDDAERRINAALKNLDRAVLAGVADCAASANESKVAYDWARSVDVTMSGPGFLSLTISDYLDCGGAHPSDSLRSIVYDVQSGRPVDWTRLLPPNLTGTLALEQGADGTKMVTLAAPRLYALYLADYRRGVTPDADEAACRQVVTEAGADAPPPMMAWLDAKGGGLAVYFALAHVVQACVDPETIPTATLQRAGAAPRLIEALVAAHKG